jgi:hypothetical protein
VRNEFDGHFERIPEGIKKMFAPHSKKDNRIDYDRTKV